MKMTPTTFTMPSSIHAYGPTIRTTAPVRSAYGTTLIKDLIKHPTMREVEDCVRTLKNRKSPGGDGLTAEIFKYSKGDTLQKLHEVICAIWTSENIL